MKFFRGAVGAASGVSPVRSAAVPRVLRPPPREKRGGGAWDILLGLAVDGCLPHGGAGVVTSTPERMVLI